MKDPGMFRLYTALLQDAERILTKTSENFSFQRMREVLEVILWVKENDTEYPFSFYHTCKYLNLTPEIVRDNLLKRYEVIRTEFVRQGTVNN